MSRLSFTYFNYSGMSGKGHIFNDMLATTLADIVACSETHFSTNTDTSPFIAGTQFEIFKKDRPTHGGGVAIFAKKSLNFQQLSYDAKLPLEAVIITNTNTLVCTVYWPPGDSRETGPIDELLAFLHTYADTHNIICTGDFNLRNVNWTYDYEESPLLIPNTETARPFERDTVILFEQFNLCQIANKPNPNGRFLDILLTNNPQNIELEEIEEQHPILAASCHHTPIAFSVAHDISPVIPSTIDKRITDHPKLTALLRRIPISFKPTRASLANIIRLVIEAFESATTIKKIKLKPYLSKHPWLLGSEEYRQQRRDLQRLQRNGTKEEIQNMRKSIHTLYNTLKKRYCEENITSNTNPNSLFDVVKFFRASNELPSKMVHCGAPVVDTITSMSAHLSSVFDDRSEMLYEGDYTANLRSLWEQNYQHNENYNNIDMAKAFDHLSHSAIIRSLAALGTPISQVQFLMQFINHRQYYVRINNKLAATPIVPSSGIPQGSNLGPTLFILACNTIAACLSPTTRIFQYADDTVLVQPILGGHSEDELQFSISALAAWAETNGMGINANKSAIMKFTKHRPDSLTQYQLKEETIPVVHSFKYLGVTLDEKLTFGIHTQNIKERCCRLVFAASRLCKTLKNHGLMMRLYQTYIDPIACYAAMVWSFRTKTTMAVAGEAHRIATRLCLKIPPSPLATNYMTYPDRCRKLNTPLNNDRLAYITATNFKRIIDEYTYSENLGKMNDALNQPDSGERRLPKPLVNAAAKFHHANTPLNYILTVVQNLRLNYEELHAEWPTFKHIMKSRHL